jgi:hypothetical protein
MIKCCIVLFAKNRVLTLFFLFQNADFWTQKINKTRNTTIYFVFFAYNNLFDHLKNQKIKRDTIDISWSNDLTRALKKALNKLSKYYAMIEEKRNTLYNIDILLDLIEKLEFYQICFFTNISHEHVIFYTRFDHFIF